MQADNLRDLYVTELQDLYSVEKQLLDALPKLANAATNGKLKQGFERHFIQTKRHVERLEDILGNLGVQPDSTFSKGMAALIEEGEDLVLAGLRPEVLDAGLISKAQHVEHYEIAGYGTVRTYADMLGMPDQARVLQDTLSEESETNEQLTALAESSVNRDAMVDEARAGRATRTDREVQRTAQDDRQSQMSSGVRRRPSESADARDR